MPTSKRKMNRKRWKKNKITGKRSNDRLGLKTKEKTKAMRKDTLMFTEDGYLNDFHRAWNEKCIKDDKEHRALMQSKGMRYSAEFLRAQSQRMDELVRQEEERLRKERKKGSKAGR